MNNIVNIFLNKVFLTLSFTLFTGYFCLAQTQISAIQPVDNAKNVQIGVIKWNALADHQYDLYFGTTANPPIYNADLQHGEEKPVILELNKKYYWKVVEKKEGKVLRTSKVFSFSTLPIQLNPKVNYIALVDTRDHKVYWTVKIGEKEWFAQNLDFDLAEMSWYYDNNPQNSLYGKLYAGKALTINQQGICPETWHIPTIEEWNDLIENSGGLKTVGKNLKDSSPLYWRTSNMARSNDSGMTVLPAGSRDSKPSYANMGKYTFFWTSTPDQKVAGSFLNIDLGFMRDKVNISPGDQNWSYSIRCVRD